MAVHKIVSGGQTGADRGGLDAAIELGLDHGGWCPRGRRAEDGVIPVHYRLIEMSSSSYAPRTEQNVLQSDATLIVTRGELSGGTALTKRLAHRHRRPLLHLDLAVLHQAEAAAVLRAWLVAESVITLNVAGPRHSTCPGIGAEVRTLLLAALSKAN